MIAVDTSALMAILLNEPAADALSAVLAHETELLISAGTAAEALIVAAGRDLGTEMASLIDGLGFEVVPVTESSARLVAEAFARWGKGAHSAGLNFGDCFAYALAKQRGCRLLHAGGILAGRMGRG